MRKYLLAALVALSANTAIAQTSADLVYLSAKDVPEENGKKFEMTFQEIKRAPDGSLVEVTYAAGSSTSSSMFILKGLCNIAQSRGQQYFRAVQVSKQPVRFGVTFPKDAEHNEVKPANVTDKVYSLAECSLLNF
jgi:hypothetical protein